MKQAPHFSRCFLFCDSQGYLHRCTGTEPIEPFLQYLLSEKYAVVRIKTALKFSLYV